MISEFRGRRQAGPLPEVPDDHPRARRIMSTAREVILLPEGDDTPAPRGRRRRHREMLVVAVLVVVGALVLRVRPDRRAELRFLPDVPLPETCMSKSLFGLPCPGCGLTRSIVYLAQGEWEQSWAMHRLGWLMAASILAQFPYRSWCLAYRDCSPGFLTACRWFGRLLIFLLVGNWLVEMLCAR